METERQRRGRSDAGVSAVRWGAVRRLVDAALELPHEERARFVATASQHDRALRGAVERLLASCERAADDTQFLSEPAAEHAAPMLHEVTRRAASAQAGIPEALASALGERYVLERVAGQGAMATVYRAHDRKFDRAVAVKVLRPELARECDVRRFQQEIRETAGLNHPHIVSVYDSGGDDGPLYYVMPFMEGSTLRHRARGRQLPIPEALAIAAAIGRGLDYAHRRGLVHRDVKPENILFQDGEPALADFGIARCLDRIPQDTWSSMGIVRGTAEYMSPEQVRAEKRLDGRSDVYALACVLFEMLAGYPPFTGRTPQMVMQRHLHDDPPSLHGARPAVPAPVLETITRALSKKPRGRPATAAAFVDALGA